MLVQTSMDQLHTAYLKKMLNYGYTHSSYNKDNLKEKEMKTQS